MKRLSYTFLLFIFFATPKGFAENWMSRLPDETYVAVVSIPGAHDAATGSGWEKGYETLGDSFARTQELNLAELWSVGVRAFDLRPCTRDGYLNINHGIVPTGVHFDKALCLLRDSLRANPSEFVVIHLLHETDGDQVEGTYNQQLLNLLNRNDLKDYFVPFRKALTVADMRGKMLLLSRDVYASSPVGGFFRNWTHDAAWQKMTQGTITGPSGATASLYVQDYPETWDSGAMENKINGMIRLMQFSTSHKTTSLAAIRWVFNFSSAYSKVTNLFGTNVSLSEGYRDNASQTHVAILDFLKDNPGPTGVVMMDYAGIDDSDDYHVRGKELVKTIIANNFSYLDDLADIARPVSVSMGKPVPSAFYSPTGRRVDVPRKGELCLIRYSDGSVRKVCY